jgi:DNA-binding response OmpR family regulator
VLESIRLSGSCHDVPVVMLVARCGSVEHEKARALGADAVVTQPFSGSVLVGAIRALMASTPSAPVPADHVGVAEPVPCHG